MKVGFLSKGERAQAGKKAGETPGPGQYQAKGIKDELNKRVWGKQGAFGSTERRFAQLTAMVLAVFYLTGPPDRKHLDQDNMYQRSHSKIR